MVCMGKDLLAYTAAMAVGAINRKVIYECYSSPVYRMPLPNSRLNTRSKVDGSLSDRKKRISLRIKCAHAYNRDDELRMAYVIYYNGTITSQFCVFCTSTRKFNRNSPRYIVSNMK